MKIIYIVKTQLHYYPPCISQIRMIKDLGYDIEVLYGTSNESAIKLLRSEGISCEKVVNIREYANTMKSKVEDWLKFRNAILRKLKTYSEDVILWFGTAESVLPLKGALKSYKYVVSLLELLDDSPKKVRLLKEIVCNAMAVTVCEETRGYIMRSWWGLEKLPVVFPNKPYKMNNMRRQKTTINETSEVVERIKDKRIIIYQGILQNSDELIEVAHALNDLNDDYVLLLMGIDKYRSVDNIRKIYSNVEYVSYIPAPYHLEITSYAQIGLVFYRDDSLNKVFCAPNKIYEYSGYGIPMIANDIPGLKNTVGKARAAECIKLERSEIKTAIKKIEANYEEYSVNANAFFYQTDNVSTMSELLDYLASKI